MKFFKKFSVFIIAFFFVCFLFIYRQYNIKQLEDYKKTQTETWTVKKDTVCVDEYKPVCWEDSKTYSNKCVAEEINSVKVAYEWECKAVSTKTSSWDDLGESNLWATESWAETGSQTEAPVVKSQEKPSEDYYKNLKSQCDNDSCCLASVDTMEQNWYREAIDWKCDVWLVKDTLKCESSYSWCIVDTNPVSTVTQKPSATGATSTWATWVINWQKVLNYNNSNYNYWFSVPSNTYFSWYWAQNWSNHSVWISTSTWVTNFWDNQVKVLYYKWKILPELEGSSYWMYQDKKNWMTYIELNWNTIVIDGWTWNDKIVDMIIKTIYAQ
jgi:hypothetical protein